jgi:putative transposase
LRRYYGPEFAGRTLDAWAYRRGVELRFIRPGKPIENAYVESFTGKFRDECLNEHWFVSIAEAQRIIEAWRINDNTVQPHRSLGQLTPAPYAAAACAGPAAGWGACSAAASATTEPLTKSEGLSLSV